MNKNEKVIIIINGPGRVGKDYLINHSIVKNNISNTGYISLHKNISSITPIQDIIKSNIKSDKNIKYRNLLYDLKECLEDFNDYTTNYLLEKTRLFLEDNINTILYVHIGEYWYIKKYIKSVKDKYNFDNIIKLLVLPTKGNINKVELEDPRLQGQSIFDFPYKDKYDYIFYNNFNGMNTVEKFSREVENLINKYRYSNIEQKSNNVHLRFITGCHINYNENYRLEDLLSCNIDNILNRVELDDKYYSILFTSFEYFYELYFDALEKYGVYNLIYLLNTTIYKDIENNYITPKIVSKKEFIYEVFNSIIKNICLYLKTNIANDTYIILYTNNRPYIRMYFNEHFYPLFKTVKIVNVNDGKENKLLNKILKEKNNIFELNIRNIYDSYYIHNKIYNNSNLSNTKLNKLVYKFILLNII